MLIEKSAIFQNAPEPAVIVEASRMDVEKLGIEGARLITPRRFKDARGYFVETYHADKYRQADVTAHFLQDNQSLSRRAGTIRGLHFQNPPHAQAKLIHVLQGAIDDVFVDLRLGSPTYGQWGKVRLSADSGRQAYLPAGLAHGFCTLEDDTIVAYKVDALYARECEAGLFWADPTLAIDWPFDRASIIISEKDAELPAFSDFRSPFAF